MRPLPRMSVRTWWEDEAWLRWVRETANYFSEHKYTHVVISPDVETASVNLESKLIMVTNELPEAQTTITIRSAAGLQRVKLLRTFIAHECAHIRFTTHPKPHGNLGFLYNALEDERIERLMAKQYDPLGGLFREMGDIFLSAVQGPLNAISACLVWRWASDHPERPMVCVDPLWHEVRPLVEAAWNEESSDGVLDIAQRILELLGEQPPDATLPTLTAPCALPGTPEAGQQSERAKNAKHKKGDKTETDAGNDDTTTTEEKMPTSSKSGKESSASANNTAGGQGDMPAPPDMSSEVGREQLHSLLKQVEPYAQRLARALMPPYQPKGYLSHKSRGRFDFERYHRGDERHFLSKQAPHYSPLGIGLLLDMSASMNDPVRLETAKRTSLMLYLACTLAQIPLEIVGFNVKTFRIRNVLDEFEPGALTLAGLRGSGGTELLPALQEVHQPITIILSDGELSEADTAKSRDFANQQDTFYVPFLIDTVGVKSYQAIFGRMIVVQDLSRLSHEVERLLEALLQSSYV